MSSPQRVTSSQQQMRISASSATRELDELMASLSDFKVPNCYHSYPFSFHFSVRSPPPPPRSSLLHKAPLTRFCLIVWSNSYMGATSVTTILSTCFTIVGLLQDASQAFVCHILARHTISFPICNWAGLSKQTNHTLLGYCHTLSFCILNLLCKKNDLKKFCNRLL